MFSIIDFAHEIIEKFEHRGTAIDMTCGNGHDTLFLKSLNFKNIYAFDLQTNAIKNTTKLVCDHNVHIIQDSHINVTEYIQSFDAAIFNLGYLPHGDKSITTNAHTTIGALKSLLTIANKPSIIVIVVYTGHIQGKEESTKLINFISTLPNKYIISKYEMLNKLDAPYVISIYTK